jgi:hypothetical protein
MGKTNNRSMSSGGFEDSDFMDVEWAAPPRQERSRRAAVVAWAATVGLLAGVPGLAWGIHQLWG